MLHEIRVNVRKLWFPLRLEHAKLRQNIKYALNQKGKLCLDYALKSGAQSVMKIIFPFFQGFDNYDLNCTRFFSVSYNSGHLEFFFAIFGQKNQR